MEQLYIVVLELATAFLQPITKLAFHHCDLEFAHNAAKTHNKEHEQAEEHLLTAHLGPFTAMLMQKGLIVNRRGRDRQAGNTPMTAHTPAGPIMPPMQPLPQAPTFPVNSGQVSSLLGMGFPQCQTEEQAVRMLQAHGNLEAAIEWLLGQSV